MSIDRRRFMKTAALATLGSPLYPGMHLRAQPSGVRPAPMMPAPAFLETNGISMGVYEQGEGPAVIFCHGFPELAFSWRDQLAAVAEAGFHAIAPDQRGYGLTERPLDPTHYDAGILCQDLVGLMDAKAIDKAVFCGHDWGGFLVWTMARLHHDRCLGVIGLNTSYSFPEGRTGPNGIARTPNYYIATFMAPGRAEAVLEADVRKTFDFFLSRGGIWDAEAFAKMPEGSAERQMDLLAMLERDNPPGDPFLSDEVMRYFTETFEITGFTGGLNWYRAIPRLDAVTANAAPRIEVPCLYIGAENDVILPPSSADGMEDYITDLETYMIMDCGHWTQQEKPEEVNKVIIDWLNRKIT